MYPQAPFQSPIEDCWFLPLILGILGVDRSKIRAYACVQRQKPQKPQRREARVREYTTVEAGAALGISAQTIRNHIKAGRLSAQQRGLMKVYFVTEAELRRFAEEYNYNLNLPINEK